MSSADRQGYFAKQSDHGVVHQVCKPVMSERNDVLTDPLVRTTYPSLMK